jgi:hypothetical protein
MYPLIVAQNVSSAKDVQAPETALSLNAAEGSSRRNPKPAANAIKPPAKNVAPDTPSNQSEILEVRVATPTANTMPLTMPRSDGPLMVANPR